MRGQAVRNRMVLQELAREYQQLYLRPEPGKSQTEEYKNIVKKGMEAEKKDLSHFIGSPEDSVAIVHTPEGDVTVVTLAERKDFETFLQIMLYHCEPEPILPSVGAMTLNGLVNWAKIRRHKEAFLKEHLLWAWGDEFKAFTSRPENYRDTMIVLARGPYSNLPAEEAGFSPEAWMDISQTIRTYHECTHVICRRRYPGKIDVLQDEIIADCIGLLAALGRYDVPLAGKFLGVTPGGYTGGRLAHYLHGHQGSPASLQQLGADIYRSMERMAELVRQSFHGDAYEMIDILVNSDK